MKNNVIALLLSAAVLSAAVPAASVKYATVSAEDAPTITDEDISGYSAGAQFAFPSQMRGAEVTPSIDYVRPKPNGTGYTEEEVYRELNDMFDRAAVLSVNSLIINTSYGGNVFFGDAASDSESIVQYTSESAFQRGFYVYLKFDIGAAMSSFGDIPLNDRLRRLSDTVKDMTANYSADGIIFCGTEWDNSPETFALYMKNGSGAGYENWLSEMNSYIFRTVSTAVHNTSSTVSVGIDVSGQVDYEYITGYSDVNSYISGGLTDFIYLETDETVQLSTDSFGQTAAGWDRAAERCSQKLIISHANDYICTSRDGWDSPDELVRQVIESEKFTACGGSVFRSLNALEQDRNGSTAALLKHYNKELTEEGLGSQLNITLPTSREFRTEDTSVIFSGTFDPNFDVYFCGEPIELNESGRFYINAELNIGENQFTFEHKGRKTVYNIVRTMRVLKTAEPREDTMYVDGGTEISFSAVAYKGSSVLAYVNGEKIFLRQAEGVSDTIDPNSSYASYTGSYIVPEGSTGGITDLGNVKIYAAYPIGNDKILECITGSRIYINEKYVPPETDDMTSAVQVNGAASGQFITVNSDNTMCWSSTNTLTVPEPDCTRLAAGTCDYALKTVTYGGTAYYQTLSGRRIRTSDASPMSGGFTFGGSVDIENISVSGGDTDMIFKLPNNTPFSVVYDGVNYADGANGGFYIKKFSSGSISLIFDYISDIPSGSITFPSGSEFTSGSWSMFTENGVSKAKLTLELAQSGRYGGVKAHFAESGRLVISFNGIPSSLDGMTIVIDPGHGYVGGGKFDPGAVRYIQEQEANLAIAKLVEQKLTAKGVNAVRFKTESQDYVTSQRSDLARQYSPDLFVAVHCNSGGESSTGAEAYYFTPFSQPLADAVSSRLGAALTKVHGSGSYDRGEKYNYFFVTQQQEFPSILIETAFVSNHDEAMALVDPEYQEIFADAIVSGIEDYVTGR